MKFRILLFWSAVIAALVLIGFDLTARIRVQRLESAASDRAQRYAALSREIQADGRKIAALRLAAAQARLAAGAQMAQTGKAARANAASAIDPDRVIAASPALRAQYLKDLRDSLDAKWNLLFHVLNLPPDEADKLRDLLAQRAANKLDVEEFAAEQGLDPDDPQVRKLAGQLNRQSNHDIADLLGPDDYAIYQQLYKEHSVAPVIVDFAGNLPTSSLTLDQASQLSQVLTAASQKTKGGYAVYGTINIDQAMSSASSILTPDQIPILAAVLQKNQADLALKKLGPSP